MNVEWLFRTLAPLGLISAVYFGVVTETFAAGPVEPSQPPGSGNRSADIPGDPARDFVARVLGSTERVWGQIFAEAGRHYQEPKLVLFRGFVQSACGMAQAAIGPFYCPEDAKVYLDLSFFDDLKNKLGAPGDFAQAYVIAREVGHHVQNLLGIVDKVNNVRMRSSAVESNALSVRVELQADCFAGVWAKRADDSRHILEKGDVEEALNAAAQMGDDRLQRRLQGYVVPESFTHGTSEQRVRWFKNGMSSGDVQACDTFNAARV